ncbi:transposase [Thermogemmatispora aurantia]|uniref:transposase n=1 Tax=Thermogemmatispora aurantia TaxID=2045279 RepID=UPI001D1342F4
MEACPNPGLRLSRRRDQGQNPLTTQDCSDCGYRVQKSLSVRTQLGPPCGLILDRDWNAALSILVTDLAWLAAHPASAGQSRTARGKREWVPRQRNRTLRDRPPLRACSRGHDASGLDERRIPPYIYAGECQCTVSVKAWE